MDEDLKQKKEFYREWDELLKMTKKIEEFSVLYSFPNSLNNSILNILKVCSLHDNSNDFFELIMFAMSKIWYEQYYEQNNEKEKL